MVKTQSREASYLLHLLNCALKGETPEKAENIDMTELLRLADFQQVYSTVLPCLEEINALSDEELTSWKNHKFSELKKTILQNSEREKLLLEFEEQGIDYMPLKGLVIREYYPKTSMRQMSDNDILYNPEKRDELNRIMKRNGYLRNGESGPSDDYIKPPCTFEFHRSLFNEKDKFGFDLDLWKRGTRCENSHRWIIDKEDNYIYSVMHMYKHYVFGGFGIRFICDVFVLRNGEKLDTDYIEAQLKKYNLGAFHNAVLHICDAVFGDGQLTPYEGDMFNAMINGTVFGKAFDLESAIDARGGKARYFFYRMFPPRHRMAQSYVRLEKAPYLLPYYYIKRLVDRSHFNGGEVRKELREIIKFKKD